MKKTLFLFMLIIPTITLAQDLYYKWSGGFGSTNNEALVGITVVPSGDVILTGTFTGTVDFDAGPGVFELTSNGMEDIFIARYTASGNFDWAKSIGGSASDVVTDIDNYQYNFTIVGKFSGTVDFDPSAAGVENQTSNGLQDIFFATFQSDGTLIHSRAIGGLGDDFASACAIGASGDVYIAGSFDGTVDFNPGVGVSDLSVSGSTGAYFAKYSSGNLSWARALDSGNNDDVYDIALDYLENVYIVSQFLGTIDFDPGAGVVNETSNAYDGYFAKYNSSGDLTWVKLITGGGYSGTHRIAVNNDQEVFIVGEFSGTIDTDPGAGSTVKTASGVYDVYFGGFDANGNFVWSLSYGTPGMVATAHGSVEIDPTGDPVFSGYGGQTDLDPGAGVVNAESVGFLVSYSQTGVFNSYRRFANHPARSFLIRGTEYYFGMSGGPVSFADDSGSFTHNHSTNGGTDIYASMFSTLAHEPLDQPTALTFSSITTNSFSGNFTTAPSAPDGYLVLMCANVQPNIDPQDGTAYSQDQILGANAGNNIYAVFIGGSPPFNLVSLTPGERLYFKIYSYNGSGAATNYLTTSPLSGSQPPLSLQPGTQASSITISNVAPTSISLNFTNGGGTNRIVVAREAGTTVNADPVDGTSYLANTNFGDGHQIGTDNFVVGQGSGPITVTGLASETSYIFRVYEFNGSGGSENYVTATATNNPATARRTWCVSTSGNDANDGTPPTPLRNIQTALSMAQTGDIIKVSDGIYNEGLITQSKVTLKGGYSTDFTETNRNIYLNKSRLVAVSTILLNDANGCTIDGFVFDGNNTAETGLNITSSSTVTHNIVVRCKQSPGQGMNISGNAIVANNTIRENITGILIFGGTSASTVFKNNIVNGNTFGQNNSSAAGIHRYNNVQGNSSNYLGNFNTPGTGDISLDPLFVNPSLDDLRLKASSPAIDRGDPSDPPGDEPLPNGGRIDMGAYGGTKNSTSAVVAPTTQASALSFTAVGANTVTVNYTAGDGNARILIAAASSSDINISLPVDGTTYSANAVYGSGTPIGNAFVVGIITGSGISDPVTVTGLNPGTSSHFRMFEFNGSTGNETYFTTTASNNPRSVTTTNVWTTFTTSATTQWLQKVFFVDPNIGFAVGYSGAIIKTVDGGNTWVAQTSGTIEILNGVHFTDANTGYAVGLDGTILKTTNGGTNWTALTSGTTAGLWDINFTDSNTGYVVGTGGAIRKTTNAGANWTALSSGTSNALYDIHFTDANTAYAVGGSGTIRKTTNAGNSWTALTSPTTNELMSVDFIDADNGYIVGYSGRVLKTTNAGTNWAETSWTAQNLFCVSFVDSNTGYAVGTSGRMIKTTNAGSTWTVEPNLTSNNLEDLFFTSTAHGIGVGLNGTIIKYSGNLTPVTEPGAQPTTLQFANTTATSTNGSFTAAVGNPTGYLVMMASGSPPDTDPVDGTPYVPGQSLGNAKVAALGSSVNFTITDATPSTLYHFKIFSYNGSGSSINYRVTTPLENMVGTLALGPEPTIQASSIIFSNQGASSIDISWTNGNGLGRVIIARLGSATNQQPVDGRTYAASATFGSGADLGSGNFVIYHGGGSSMTLSGLTNGSTYYVASFEFGGTTGTENYLLTNPATSSFLKVSLDATPPDVVSNTASSIQPGQNLTISATITDGQSSVTNASVEFRSISQGGIPFNRALTASGSTYTTQILASEIGELGIEFRISASSAGGNHLEPDFTTVRIDMIADDGLTIPISSFGNSVGNYHIIAVPLELTEKSINTVFDELEGYDPERWRIYHYTGGKNTELTTSSQILTGKGYWLIVKDSPGVLKSGPGKTVPVTSDAPFEIDLVSGWNQIGNPYNFNLSWADVQAANLGLPGLRTYDSDYADGTILKVMEGGFVNVDVNTTIVLPVIKNTAVNGRVKNHKTPFLNPIDDNNWQVYLTLSQGERINRIAGFGMHEQAAEKRDQFDGLTMPRFFGSYLEVNHTRIIGAGKLSKDIVQTKENYVWEFDIDTSLGETVLSFAWDNSYFGENEKALVLWDVRQQIGIDMRKNNSYTFEKNKSRSFKVFFGSVEEVKEKSMASRFVFHSISPNPAVGEAVISFSLPYSAVESTVDAEVYDLMGKQIWHRQDKFRAGYHELRWRIQNEQAPGVYVIQLKRGSAIEKKRIILKSN